MAVTRLLTNISGSEKIWFGNVVPHTEILDLTAVTALTDDSDKAKLVAIVQAAEGTVDVGDGITYSLANGNVDQLQRILSGELEIQYQSAAIQELVHTINILGSASPVLQPSGVLDINIPQVINDLIDVGPKPNDGNKWVLEEQDGNLTWVQSTDIGDDGKVKISSNDTTLGYLANKIQVSGDITLTENNDGGNETITLGLDLEDVNVSALTLTFGGSNPSGLTTGPLESTGGSKLGYLLPVNGTIEGIAVLTDAENNYTYKIYKNGSLMSSLLLDHEISKLDNTLSIDAVAGDIIKVVRMNPASNIDGQLSADSNTLALFQYDGDDEANRYVTNASSMATGMGGRSVGATLGASGKFTNAASFDGVNDHIEFMHHQDYNVENATIELWFYPESISGDQMIFSRMANTRNGGGNFQIGLVGASLYIESESSVATHTFTSPSPAVSINTWHHIAVVLGTGGIKVYLDGTEVHHELAWTWALQGNFRPILLGASLEDNVKKFIDVAGGKVTKYFEGRICEVRISSNRRYEVGFTPSPSPFTLSSNTLGLWHLDEASGSVAYDSSDITHNGYLQTSGSLSMIVDSPVKHGNAAIELNGSVNDWFRFNHNAAYEVTEFTWESWINPHNNSNTGAIFQKGTSGTEGGLIIKYVGSGGKVEVSYYGATTSRVITTSINSFVMNEWTHLAVTIDANELIVYIDGIQFQKETLTADFANVLTKNTEDVYIGTDPTKSTFAEVYLDETCMKNEVVLYGLPAVKEDSVVLFLGK